MGKSFLAALMMVGFVGAGFAANAQDAHLNDGVIHLDGDGSQQDLGDLQASLMNQTGFHIDPSDLSASVIVETNVQRAFAGAAHLRANLPAGQLPTSFMPIISDIKDYIDQTAAKNNERDNGINNNALATRIVRLSFCFGTDPYGVAAQIKTESYFDRHRVSPTGAVGLTQMTSIAIDEVNDQLGNRGEKAANAANIPYLRQAISCYTGGRAFSSMFSAGAIPQGATVNGKPALSSKAKAWLKADIERQLIYGQIVLKVYLARATTPVKPGASAYLMGMQNYNGDKRKGEDKKYAKTIVHAMQNI